jgi:hypothetical protein
VFRASDILKLELDGGIGRFDLEGDRFGPRENVTRQNTVRHTNEESRVGRCSRVSSVLVDGAKNLTGGASEAMMRKTTKGGPSDDAQPSRPHPFERSVSLRPIPSEESPSERVKKLGVAPSVSHRLESDPGNRSELTPNSSHTS